MVLMPRLVGSRSDAAAVLPCVLLPRCAAALAPPTPQHVCSCVMGPPAPPTVSLPVRGPGRSAGAPHAGPAPQCGRGGWGGGAQRRRWVEQPGGSQSGCCRSDQQGLVLPSECCCLVTNCNFYLWWCTAGWCPLQTAASHPSVKPSAPPPPPTSPPVWQPAPLPTAPALAALLCGWTPPRPPTHPAAQPPAAPRPPCCRWARPACPGCCWGLQGAGAGGPARAAWRRPQGCLRTTTASISSSCEQQKRQGFCEHQVMLHSAAACCD